MTETSAIEIAGLSLSIPGPRGPRPLLLDVSLDVRPGEAVGLVGESGSGKSLTVRLLAGLQPRHAQVHGTARVLGRDVLNLRGRALREHRMHSIGMIFQDPRAHINPVRTVGDFLTEALIVNANVPPVEATRRVIALLEEVGIARAEHRLRQYPHELSGGLLQRVMIAAVLAADPAVLLADEPTTALDVTTQADVMALINRIRLRRNLAMLFITHDLDLAAAVCDRISVMYAGCVVESQPVATLLETPLHPYTRALLDSRPGLDVRLHRLPAIPGRPAAASETRDQCTFAPRCLHAIDECRAGRPPYVAYQTPAATLENGTRVACVRAGKWQPSEATSDAGHG